MKKLITAIMLVLLTATRCVYADGLLTTIVGEVYDADSREALEGVNIYVKGTDVGTATTKEGIFLLRIELSGKAVMVVSAVGYEKQEFIITPGMSAGIDVALKETRHYIEEVFVLPGSNPALPLLDSVRLHRRDNKVSPDMQSARNEVNVSIGRLSAAQLKRKFWRSMRGAMHYATDSSLVLPLYSRVVSDGKTTDKTMLLSDSHWQILLSDFDMPSNFYSNSLAYLNVGFLSPIAADGNHYYRYYLSDSVVTDGVKQYKVRFYTKNVYYPTFNGEMLIDSATYALSYIKAEVPSEVNVNYLKGLSIEQHFLRSESGRYILSTENVEMLLDFDVKIGEADIFPSLLISSVTSVVSPMAVDNKQVMMSTDTSAAKDSVSVDLPLLRVATFAAKIIQTAYIPTGTCVDIGKVPDILHINPIETVRIAFPLRTNERFSRRVCLEGYAAYGFGDREWKGEGKVQVLLPTERRSILSLRYTDQYDRSDVDEMTRLKRENSMWFSDMGISMHIMNLFARSTYYSASVLRLKELSLSADLDLSDNVEARFSLASGYRGCRYSKAGAMVRVGWKEKKVDMHFQRIHVYSHLPVLYFYGELGNQYTETDNYKLYGKMAVMLRHEAQLGIYGRLDYGVEAGAVVGDVPQDMLHIFEGNSSYAYEPSRFTLLEYNEASASRYVALLADWNGKGCLFNMIPVVQRLRLNELAVFKFAYGGDLKVPYVEAGLGIGNILRVGEVYAVWRLTHFNDLRSPWWGIRMRLHIE